MDIKAQFNGKLRDFMAFIKNADEKTLYYIFGGVLVFVLILDYLILMRPQINALTRASSQISVLQQEISTTENHLLRLNNYRDEIKKLKEDIERSQFRIRSREEVAVILERISRLANEYNIKIDQIKPETGSQKSLLKSSDREYFNLPFSFQGSCDFHQFGKFLAKLEQDEIFFKAASFNIIPTDDLKKQDIKVTINTIVYDEKKK